MANFNPSKDSFEIFSDEIIDACKNNNDSDLKKFLTKKDYVNQSRSLVYYEYLKTYNKTNNVKETAHIHDADPANIRVYISTAFQRVKRFKESQQL